MHHILLLGGTTEASALARLLAAQGMSATLSYAGRTENPRPQPVPCRIGGFGGVEGLVAYLREHRVTHLVDATHPFAARMSAHASAAARIAGVPFVALTRPAWRMGQGDNWTGVAGIEEAVAALAGPPRRVLLALGRMHVDAFAAQPQHHYLLRFVDAPDAPPLLPDHHLVVDRGPFSVAGDRALLRDHAIDLVVSKNAGGTGAQAKLIAARELGLPVLMIERPAMPDRRELFRPEEVLDWIAHTPATERGV
ncbi:MULTISPECIES: cobalt-precorrin-6A reductase [unclassified Novosphingobium]|uniref:cobalt-precorrin-6A reductase n=1 Tax=unclassified Novosphingobium TaxID=2644732 RepID=UPI00086E5900|nr:MULTISPECIES: cobalt-precorrin-6A reductase [unclassified Novosphingobium]MBN9144484.1 cobalt-precorrin-6A reductase [Novosphingobium sp.]MDR6707814.1 precorrin-6A/cobalt-precorrin-6A reductase [Novosphingobium sp. 1748]ODU84037.1 MAG: cobalt-precorrin-6A reductase [Novosphingobium sp. SCN 63-17]OJX93589.1 MAG: cobalt-precorrin-6A reductase [Novosphingobium sp. 63-713]